MMYMPSYWGVRKPDYRHLQARLVLTIFLIFRARVYEGQAA